MHDAYFWAFVLYVSIRLAGALFVVARRNTWQPSLPAWRKWTWLAGMIVVLLLVSRQVLQLSLPLLSERVIERLAWLFQIPLVTGLVLVLGTAALLAFGKGRARWLGWLLLLPSLPEVLGVF